ncbi:MAG: glycerophosphodiester phosphodiesterase, partial [Oscillospiraceae bacterium]|nr:glycerophosphodiester phosphodiesterase [Oscillospiraceae bacterium]
NVATRPDFISYKFTDADNISLKLCRLMGAKTACWTLRSTDDYNSVKGGFDMYIFDSFDISQAE